MFTFNKLYTLVCKHNYTIHHYTLKSNNSSFKENQWGSMVFYIIKTKLFIIKKQMFLNKILDVVKENELNKFLHNYDTRYL